MFNYNKKLNQKENLHHPLTYLIKLLNFYRQKKNIKSKTSMQGNYEIKWDLLICILEISFDIRKKNYKLYQFRQSIQPNVSFINRRK